MSSSSTTLSLSSSTLLPSSLSLALLSARLVNLGVTGVMGVNGMYGLYGVCGTPAVLSPPCRWKKSRRGLSSVVLTGDRSCG